MSKEHPDYHPRENGPLPDTAPCTYCSGVDHTVLTVREDGADDSYSVRCGRCGCCGPTGRSPGYAVAYWNKWARAVKCAFDILNRDATK